MTSRALLARSREATSDGPFRYHSGGFGVLWNTYLEPMLVGILVTGVVAGLLYKYLERKAQSWGTLEFY